LAIQSPQRAKKLSTDFPRGKARTGETY
jgi:hypothetical protein